MLRILLVSVVHQASEVERRYPDLGLGYLAAGLRQQFGSEIDVRIIDKDYEKVIGEYRPHFIGLRSVFEGELSI